MRPNGLGHRGVGIGELYADAAAFVKLVGHGAQGDLQPHDGAGAAKAFSGMQVVGRIRGAEAGVARVLS
jgi:hypothetical protein